ncbi:MAG: ABC-type transport auxiliary lipoprotein family protein [Burkholderiaceae bacterium]
MQLIAVPAIFTLARGQLLLIFVLLGLISACGVIDKPVRSSVYDFGPGPAPAQAAPILGRGGLPPLVLADIDAVGTLDGTAVLYRLAYADSNLLRPYAQSRWSAPPPQLVRQRLREQWGRERVVLSPGENAALSRSALPGTAAPRMLRLELEEFSHFFDSPAQSAGLLRLRATLLEITPAGEQLLAQRSFTLRQNAASNDAPGGVRALAAATDAAAQEISLWLGQQR